MDYKWVGNSDSNLPHFLDKISHFMVRFIIYYISFKKSEIGLLTKSHILYPTAVAQKFHDQPDLLLWKRWRIFSQGGGIWAKNMKYFWQRHFLKLFIIDFSHSGLQTTCIYVCIHHHHNSDQVLCLKSLYKYIIIILVKVSFCLCLYKDIIIKYKYKYIIIIVKVSIYLCVHLQVYSPELFLPRLWKKNHLK